MTGVELIRGVNASLDHKFPTSRGGSSSVENLQWVTKTVNLAKRDMTVEEFLVLCRALLDHAAIAAHTECH